jgi:general stress protein CsbA
MCFGFHILRTKVNWCLCHYEPLIMITIYKGHKKVGEFLIFWIIMIDEISNCVCYIYIENFIWIETLCELVS